MASFVRIKFNEQSVANVLNNVQKLFQMSATKQKQGLKKVAQNIMAQSQSEVPRETNTLADAAYIENPKNTANGVSIRLGYGGPKDKQNPATGKMASEYALIQHETPGTPPGGGNYHPYGKWKFLEDPARAHQNEFVNIIGSEMRTVFAPGVKSR